MTDRGTELVAAQLATGGVLRVGIWMVPYFARRDADELRGVIVDLGRELGARIGAAVCLLPFDNPAQIMAAFRGQALDVTFLGITADRAEIIAFGPVVMALRTTYLVPATSKIAAIAEIDRAGVRIAVPAKSAQEAHLRATLTAAELLPVPAESPQRAIEMLRGGEAEAFSHVAPMLAAVRDALPGSRVLDGSYFDVPVAIGVARGRSPAAAEFAARFVEDVKRSGLVQRSLDQHGVSGVVVPG